MRKLYVSTLSVCFGLLAGGAFAQTDAELSTTEITPERQAEILSQVEVRGPEMFARAGGACDTVYTPMVGDNSFNGVMFDVDANFDITVNTFWVTTDPASGPQNIAIFARMGTFVGNETSSAGWTFLDSAIVTGIDNVTPVMVPVTLNYPMLSGSLHAFYVTTTSAGTFYYSNGTAVGNPLVSNADFTLYEGHGGSYPFSVTFNPRNFNGIFDYCQGVVGVEEENIINSMQLYPNPVEDVMSVSFQKAIDATIEVVNLTGQMVIRQELDGVTNMDIDVSDLDSGIYFITTSTDGYSNTQKFIVK